MRESPLAALAAIVAVVALAVSTAGLGYVVAIKTGLDETRAALEEHLDEISGRNRPAIRPGRPGSLGAMGELAEE